MEFNNLSEEGLMQLMVKLCQERDEIIEQASRLKLEYEQKLEDIEALELMIMYKSNKIFRQQKWF